MVSLVCGLWAGVACLPVAGNPAQPLQTAHDIPQLIAALSDSDPAVRRSAGERLTQLGLAARPAVLRAMRSDNPEARARAAEVLRHLPWDQPGDPRPIRAILSHYGNGPDTARRRIVRQIDHIPGGDRVLLRLLTEEPSDAVRWTIAFTLIITRDADKLGRIRDDALLSEGEDPPALLLAGRAWIERDKTRGLGLLRRAIDADEVHPTGDGGLLGFAYEQLIDDAMAQKQWNEAASLLRRRLPRLGWRSDRAALLGPLDDVDDERDDASRRLVLPRLMALHELLGPLDRFEFDVRTWGQQDTAKPTLARQLAFFFARLGIAPPLLCQPVDLLGEEHIAAAEFLLRSDLPVAAQIQAQEALNAPRKLRPEWVQYRALRLRAQLAIQAGDDASAADLLESAIHARANLPSRANLAPQDDDDWAQIQWFRAKVAWGRHDMKTADARIHDLLQLDPGNTDLALNIIDWLKQHDRATAAKSIFEKLYVQAKARLDSADAETVSGYQNDLAWLCARSGEHLDEAVQLAQSAVQASPDNPAFLDTLAEAHFRAGHRDQAVKYESKALELSPDNSFMKQQLERFEGKGPKQQGER